MVDGIDRNYQRILPIKIPAIKRLGQVTKDGKRKFDSNRDLSDDKKSKLLAEIYGKTGQTEPLCSNDNHFIDLNV